MQKRKLGKSGLEVSGLGLSCMGIGATVEVTESGSSPRALAVIGHVFWKSMSIGLPELMGEGRFRGSRMTVSGSIPSDR